MRYFATLIMLAVGMLSAFSQLDSRTVVGVAKFSCDQKSPYTGLVTEKVAEMLTNTHRFRVVDRTSIDKIHEELELQKSEAFLDSKNTVEQDIAVAAEKMITGHITKIPVYAIHNANGLTRGYKASVAFEMKVVDVATGLSSEATSFQGKASKECISQEAAVNMAMQSVQDEIYQWFRVNFPITCGISKILDDSSVLIKAGSSQGIEKNQVFIVEAIEMLDGAPYHRNLGEIRVKNIAGPNFSECKVSKNVMKQIQTNFDNAVKLQCTLKLPK